MSGEYISREAAINELNAEGYTKNMRIHKRILAIPTADVMEVRHGRWKLGICQECLFDWSEVSLYVNVPNYCPSCGAKMDLPEPPKEE